MYWNWKWSKYVWWTLQKESIINLIVKFLLKKIKLYKYTYIYLSIDNKMENKSNKTR